MLAVLFVGIVAYLRFRPRPVTLGIVLFGSASIVCLVTLCVSSLKLKKEIDKRATAQYYLRLAYAALELGNRHLNGILESTPDAIASVDLELQWIAFNARYSASFQRKYGSNPEMGARLDEVSTSNSGDVSEAVALWRRALAGETFSITET